MGINWPQDWNCSSLPLISIGQSLGISILTISEYKTVKTGVLTGIRKEKFLDPCAGTCPEDGVVLEDNGVKKTKIIFLLHLPEKFNEEYANQRASRCCSYIISECIVCIFFSCLAWGIAKKTVCSCLFGTVAMPSKQYIFHLQLFIHFESLRILINSNTYRKILC